MDNQPYCVHDEMTFKVTQQPEALAANLTLKHLLLQIETEMVIQIQQNCPDRISDAG